MCGDIVMKIFKTATNRLIRYFEKSRDAWKARALQKQQQLRFLKWTPLSRQKIEKLR